MKTKTNAPTVTKKYHIEVPTHTYDSDPSIFKVWFGKHYLIWKGKSLLQSCQFLAENIERYIRLQKNIDTDYLYHVCNHVKRTRCMQATVEVLGQDFIRRGTEEAIDGFKMLKMEQDLLNKAKNDTLCLNNNLIAYVSGWITKKDQEKFSEYLKPKVKK